MSYALSEMTKPFSLHELRARCRALLRRKREAKLLLRAGNLELDRMNHTGVRGGEEIALTNKEFALLEHLMLNRGQCVSRVELLETVWKLEPAQTTNIVDVYVNYLRRKLKDPAPGHILRTVRQALAWAVVCGYATKDAMGIKNPKRSVTSDPHGSVRLATPMVPLVNDPPHASAPPPPYHEASTERYTFRRPSRRVAARR